MEAKTTKPAPKKPKTPKKAAHLLPSQEDITEKLIFARLQLLMKAPFFGNMATRLKLVREDKMPTAATDGRNFYYNLEFIDSLTTKETAFLFGHEVLHNVFEHHFRREGRDPRLWNIAVDYAVNQILIDNNIGEKITTIPILHNEKFRGMSGEEIYDALFSDMDKLNIPELLEQLLDEHMDGIEEAGHGLTPSERASIREEIKGALLGAAQSCGAGAIPSGVDRLVKAFTEPKMNWREVLRQDIQSTIKSDYTFVRPNKKAMQGGFTIPGMQRDQSLDICVAIDMSGSISDDDAATFLSEVRGIMQQYNDYTIHIWCFDTEVHNPQVFRSDEGADITTYKVKGGGGTLFECNWNFMRENEINPKTLIMFTDMCPCGSWGEEEGPQENMIFAAHKANGIVAPFGTTIEIKD